MKKHLVLLLGWLVVAATPGCVSRMAAHRLLAAPNAELVKRQATMEARWNQIRGLITTNPLPQVRIPVGPPSAILSAYSVPAGEYHRRFISRVETKPDGGGSISLIIETNQLDTFSPLPAPATVIVLHGYGMMKEGMIPWAVSLAQAGFRVIAIDLRGHGQSTGSTIGYGVHETTDLSQALDYLIARGLCDEKVGVLGLSYGATLALNWAARERRVGTVVAIAPYDDPQVTFQRFAAMAGISLPARVIRFAARSAARRLNIKWADWAGATALGQIHQPVFLIGGALDPICPPADLQRMKSVAGGEAVQLVLPGANHYVVAGRLEPLLEPVEMWFKKRLAPAVRSARLE
jgi:pimeloyl-ACP methyl ester carboxylesterase